MSVAVKPSGQLPEGLESAVVGGGVVWEQHHSSCTALSLTLEIQYRRVAMATLIRDPLSGVRSSYQTNLN